MGREEVEVNGVKYRVAKYAAKSVSPKACLWFAFSPNGGINGPFGDVGEAFRPEFDGTGGVSFGKCVLEVKKPGVWAHGAGAALESGPNGRTNRPRVVVEKTGYSNQSNVQYQFENPNGFHLNTLIALFEFGAGARGTQPATLVSEIGVGPTELDVPHECAGVHIGFHDGYEWSNNRGDSMDVDVMWVV